MVEDKVNYNDHDFPQGCKIIPCGKMSLLKPGVFLQDVFGGAVDDETGGRMMYVLSRNMITLKRISDTTRTDALWMKQTKQIDKICRNKQVKVERFRKPRCRI